MASDLVKRYTDYRIKNEQIKARQRREREKELLPFLIDIGRAVDEDRSNGHSVPELAGLISNKNRNFLYGAMRAYRATLLEQVELDLPEVSRFEAEPAYHMEYLTGGSFCSVCFMPEGHGGGHEYRAFVLDGGTVVDYPEGIAERYGKPFLKKLIAEVEREAAQN